jgi:hypothetical protein
MERVQERLRVVAGWVVGRFLDHRRDQPYRSLAVAATSPRYAM